MTVTDMAALLEMRGLLKEFFYSEDREAGKERKNEEIRGNTGEAKITWLTCDSREAVPGTLFICKGAAFRPEYLQQAVEKGALGYIISDLAYEKLSQWEVTEKQMNGAGQKQNEGRTLAAFIVNDIRKAMAVVSAAFFEYKPGQPTLTGITGTKGKTTTAWYLKAMLDCWERQKDEKETGLISTVENYDGVKREDAVMTTPEAPTIHEMLANAKNQNLRYLTMEVSSQALKYRRVKELRFQVGIFLNISEDHISPVEHEDFEDYFSAKLSLFRQTEVACVNLDSDHREQILLAAQRAKRVVTFGQDPRAMIRCSAVRIERGQISFRVTCDRFSQRFYLGMKGRFNIENAMAAIAAAYVYGVPAHCMEQALEQTKVPGRMETFYNKEEQICGVVDFAHNRLSFEKLFDAACGEYPEYKKIITVFGCPGGKAYNRRRELGILAGRYSDFVCITSDDPGMECQEDIANQVKSYVELTGCPCKSIADRGEAIQYAVELAKKNQEKTLILVLGRGCEKFQKIGRASYAYPTDAQMLREAL